MPEQDLFKKNLQAVLLASFGWALFVISDTTVKWLSQYYGISQIICLSNALGIFISLAWLLKKYGMAGFQSPYLKWHLIRGATIIGTAYFVLKSLSLIPLADFYGIVFLNPMLLSIFSFFLYGEKIGWHRAAAIIVGFIGVLILAGPQFSHYNAGILYAFCAVFFICGSSLCVRKMRDERKLPLYAFFPMVFGFLFFLPAAVVNFTPPPVFDLVINLSLAPVVVIAIVALAMGFAKTSEIAIVAPFHYTQIIWGAALGYLIFGDIPSWTTVLGIILIAGGGIYLLYREHALHKKALAQSFSDPAPP